MFSTVLAWNTKTYADKGPQSWADFWDVKKFPGKRSYRKGRRRCARAGADGRRRSAGQGLRGAVGTRRDRAGDQEDQGTEAACRSLVVVRRAACAAHEGRRGRHDHRVERPLRRGRERRRQGRLHLQPGPARLRLLRDCQGSAEQGSGDEVPRGNQQAAVPGRVHEIHHLRSDQQKGLRHRRDRCGLRQAPAVPPRRMPPSSCRSISTGISNRKRTLRLLIRTC